MDDTVPTTSNMSDCTLPPRVEKPPPKVCKHRVLSWTSCFAKQQQNTTMQPFNQCSNSKLKQEWCWLCHWSSGIGAWLPMIFNPFQSQKPLETAFCIILRYWTDIVWVNECDAKQFTDPLPSDSIFSLPFGGVTALTVPEVPTSSLCDWLVPVWTAQYGNKVPQVGWTDRDVAWCYMMLRHPDLRPVCRCLKTHHFVRLSFWKIQDPFLLSILDQVTKVDQLGTNSSDNLPTNSNNIFL